MEEGSLLQLALDRTAALSSGNSTHCLFLDVYSIRDDACGPDCYPVSRHLLYLAELANRINAFFQSKNYLWHYGGDGPVFGIHVTEGIPHLRAYCRYGPSVQDEWMAIHYLREFMVRTDNDDERGNERFREDDIAGAAWDVHDGQIILIQMADLLPEWLDEDSTDNHRHACWLYRGHLQLLHKPHLTLPEALQQLQRLKKERQNAGASDAIDSSSSSHPRIQRALEYWLELNVQESQLTQRTPLVLPRTVARFLRDRPELLHTAIQAFCEHLQMEEPQIPPSSPSASGLPDLTKYSDWVWTRHTMSRTNYAMVRTMVSSWGWTTPDVVPPLVGVEVKRYNRQCNSELTTHLKHAVAVGVRVVAGLEYILTTSTETSSQSQFASSDIASYATARPLSSLQERTSCWVRIEQEFSTHYHKMSGETLRNGTTTILESFQQGPNHSNLDLTYVLKCPVFPEEENNWTVLSHPQLSLREQILNGLKQSSKDDSHDADAGDKFWMPRQDQVDGEDWLELLPERPHTESNGGINGGVESVQDLNRMLSRFQTFMNQTSDVEGIETGNRPFTVNDHHLREQESISSPNDTRDEMEIRPHVFLNILYAVLKGEELNFPPTETADPYFYKDDYDLMSDDLDDREDNDTEKREGAVEMKALMNAMDDELKARTESRRLDSGVGAPVDDCEVEGEEISGDVAHDAHVLSNLLQSLEASAGDSGPVLNMLKEMEGEH